MQEFMEKVQALVDGYDAQLAQNGICVSVSKKYFETAVHQKYARGGIMRSVERKWLKKQEIKKGYHFQNNRYHCIVLTLRPVDKELLQKEECRQYAFVLQKVERAYIGEKPEKRIYEENKILGKIEKRICRILQAAQNSSPAEMCHDTWIDAIRYLTAVKYSFKNRILGKDRNTLELLLMIVSSVIVFLAVILFYCLLT